MAKNRKITQNVNKDAGLLDLPKVHVQNSKWQNKHSNYVSCNIGEIYPIYCEEVMPKEKKRITMGMLSHMTTPIAPIFNAQYTEFRAMFVPHRLSADLLAGYKTRKSPWVKVFGEDNATASANVTVSLSDQKLPSVSNTFATIFYRNAIRDNLKPFGGLADALDLATYGFANETAYVNYFKKMNFLNIAAYELIYQYKYRNQNRESATSSSLYRFLCDAYNRNDGSILYDDEFHIANREKDYFTGAQPFTQKGDPVTVGLLGEATVTGSGDGLTFKSGSSDTDNNLLADTTLGIDGPRLSGTATFAAGQVTSIDGLVADLSSATGINIETLRLMIKTQELLEKDMMYGTDYASSLNAHFGTAPISLILEEPLELKKVTITSHMQPVLQSSSTSGESTILGTIGANATTQSGEFEIVPETEFKEWGYLIICAVHKAQNSYDSSMYKPKHLFKKARFDFYTPELDDLGYQSVDGDTFLPSTNSGSPVGFNEAWAEYRYNYNKVHGMFEPSRANALDYWTLAISNYADIQTLYKQGKTELDRAISVTSSTAPQFFDAYGFIEICDKPMKLHSIPGMDGVI